MRAHTTVARERYAWPGGYLLAAVMNDGESVCPDCVRENYRTIAHSTRHEMRDGWQCIGLECAANVDSMGLCAHCGRDMDTL